MKIKLSTFDRLVASSLLPNEGKYHELKHLREVKESLSMTEAEHKLFQPHVINDQDGKLNARWDKINEAIPEKEIDFHEWLFNIIYDELRDQEKNGKLPMERFSLYEKFVKDYNNKDEDDKETSK